MLPNPCSRCGFAPCHCNPLGMQSLILVSGYRGNGRGSYRVNSGTDGGRSRCGSWLRIRKDGPNDDREQRSEANRGRIDARGRVGLGGAGHGEAQERLRGIYELHQKDPDHRRLRLGRLPFHPDFRCPQDRRDLLEKTSHPSSLPNK